MARSASATISDVMDRNVECHPNPVHVNEVKTANLGYVDDTLCMDYDAIGTKFSSQIIEETLEELALQAHNEKTKLILCGKKEWVEKTKLEIEADPPKIQGFTLKIEKMEKYLGVKIVSGEINDIIDANIRYKSSLSHQTATDIRQEVRDPRIQRLGALQASSIMLKSRIVPILTYGTECWLNVSQAQYQEMEKLMAVAISRVLSIPKNSNYEAMLLETSNFHLEQWMDCLKLCYFVKKLHRKKSGRLYRILRKDIINDDSSGFIGDIKNLSIKYKKSVRFKGNPPCVRHASYLLQKGIFRGSYPFSKCSF